MSEIQAFGSEPDELARIEKIRVALRTHVAQEMGQVVDETRSIATACAYLAGALALTLSDVVSSLAIANGVTFEAVEQGAFRDEIAEAFNRRVALLEAKAKGT